MNLSTADHSYHTYHTHIIDHMRKPQWLHRSINQSIWLYFPLPSQITSSRLIFQPRIPSASLSSSATPPPPRQPTSSLGITLVLLSMTPRSMLQADNSPAGLCKRRGLSRRCSQAEA